MMTPTLKGNFPILATAWADDGRFDPASQARLIDWLIDSGVHGLVMAANASEGHAQSDAEKEQILAFGMKRVAGRVPVVVTVTHFAVEIAVEKARCAASSAFPMARLASCMCSAFLASPPSKSDP